jgi:hypothetical protein
MASRLRGEAAMAFRTPQVRREGNALLMTAGARMAPRCRLWRWPVLDSVTTDAVPFDSGWDTVAVLNSASTRHRSRGFRLGHHGGTRSRDQRRRAIRFRIGHLGGARYHICAAQVGTTYRWGVSELAKIELRQPAGGCFRIHPPAAPPLSRRVPHLARPGCTPTGARPPRSRAERPRSARRRRTAGRSLRRAPRGATAPHASRPQAAPPPLRH